MDKKIVGVISAVTGMAALGGAAQAATAPTPDTGNMNARSFAELLDPIPNALATLRATDAATREQATENQTGEVQVAGYRHHHHHRYHHHHHHHRAIVIRPPRVYIRGHHHHHHHNPY